MTGIEYENYCGEYLKGLDFHDVMVTKASGDQGVDITAFKNGQKFAFQCKYYDQPVGNKAVQEVYSGKTFYDCQRAVVITNNTFTPQAVELANKLGVDLWNSIYPTSSYVDNSEDDDMISYDDYYSAVTNTIFTDTPDALYETFYRWEKGFRQGVDFVETALSQYSPFDFSKKENCKKLLETGINLLFISEWLEKMFLIKMEYKGNGFILHYSREVDIPISNNIVNKIQSHFNYLSRSYKIEINQVNSISIDVKTSKKPWGYKKENEYNNYLQFKHNALIDEWKNLNIRAIQDGNRSEILFNNMTTTIAIFINYYLFYIAGPDKSILINPSYLMDVLYMDAITYDKRNGYIWFYYHVFLNNRAMYDNQYKKFVSQNPQRPNALIIKARLHICDYWVQNNMVTINNYPEITYSYEDCTEASMRVMPVMNMDNNNLIYIHKKNFLTVKDYDIR